MSDELTNFETLIGSLNVLLKFSPEHTHADILFNVVEEHRYEHPDVVDLISILVLPNISIEQGKRFFQLLDETFIFY